MTESAPSQTSPIEQESLRRIEVRHYPSSDIVINWNTQKNYPYHRERIDGKFRAGTEHHRILMRRTQLMNSIVNEIALSPTLKELVDSKEIQELAQSYGFNSMQFVEPIMGVIDKNSRKKRQVYKYIHQAVPLDTVSEKYGFDQQK